MKKPDCSKYQAHVNDYQVSDELHSVNVRRFFENLLPEGKALVDAAAARTISTGNLFGLLRWLGMESKIALDE